MDFYGSLGQQEAVNASSKCRQLHSAASAKAKRTVLDENLGYRFQAGE